LGHGFPFAAGIALGLKIKHKSNLVYVLIGDGEANEGTIWETAMVSAHRRLDNLIGILDDNQSTGRCLPLTDVAKKWMLLAGKYMKSTAIIIWKLELYSNQL